MPEQKIVNPSFASLELELEPFKLQYSLDELVKRVLAHAMGYYEAGEQHKFLRVNSAGELLVSSEGGQVSSGTIAKVTVGSTAGLVIAANTNRREILLYNDGVDDIYIGFNSNVTTSNGFLLPVGTSFSTDVYIGDFYAIRSGINNCSLYVMEF